MWNKRTRSSVGRTLAAVFVGGVQCGIVFAAQETADLPAGLGAEIVRAQCLTCHQADLIRQQRLTRTGWQRELDKMTRWGASLTQTERDTALEYLAAHWPPPPAVATQPADVARGDDVFRRRCLSCHQTDIVDQQRLARAGWAREVDKMVRWGATVSGDERDVLLDYLAGESGRQARK
jgi:mono/diheme cytochrome c family protein